MAAIDELAKRIASGFLENVDRETLSRESREIMESLFGERYQARSAHATRVVFMSGNDNLMSCFTTGQCSGSRYECNWLLSIGVAPARRLHLRRFLPLNPQM